MSTLKYLTGFVTLTYIATQIAIYAVGNMIG